MAQNVTDFGAVGDGTTDDTQAIRDAADAAGPGGTVFFPGGHTYLVGSNTRMPFLYPTDGSWDNLTWQGEGYDTTTIKMAGGQSKFHFAWRLGRGGDAQVDSATFKRLTIDGNKANQDSRGKFCLAEDATGVLTMRDCAVLDWKGGGLQLHDAINADVQYCHFADNGDPASNASHAINPNQSAPTTTQIRWCLIENSAGADIDVGVDTGADYQTVEISDCYFNSGRDALKLDPGNVKTTVTNTKMVAGSRTTMQIKVNNNDFNCGSLELREVIIDGGSWPAVDIDAGGFDRLSMDQTAIMNVEPDGNRNAGMYVSDADFGSSGTISVHNIGSNNDGDAVKFTDTASGSIDRVIYGGTSSPSSWRTNGVSVGTVTKGTPLDPSVPAATDVGPRSGSTTDTPTPTPTATPTPTETPSAYGGYNKPAAGTTDWHLPLNENFEDIEADVLDLAARIDALENN